MGWRRVARTTSGGQLSSARSGTTSAGDSPLPPVRTRGGRPLLTGTSYHWPLPAAAGGGGGAPARRYVWVDMFCASQNLLAGVYKDASLTDKASEAYRARKEDTDSIFDGAIDAG